MDLSKLKPPKAFDSGRRVLDLLAKERVEVSQLSRAISQDPGLTAALIRYANAPMYRRLIEVTNVTNAINILGIKNVRLTVLVASMRSYSNQNSALLEMISEHSFGVAILAKMIAERICRPMAEDIELTGLVHDLGMLILADNFPVEYQRLVEQARSEEVPFEQLEREYFGVSHDEILIKMADELRLPSVTRRALENFHAREPIHTVKSVAHRHTKVVALAHLLEAEVYSEKGRPMEQIPESLETLQTSLCLSADDLLDLTEAYESVLNNGYVV